MLSPFIFRIFLLLYGCFAFCSICTGGLWIYQLGSAFVARLAGITVSLQLLVLRSSRACGTDKAVLCEAYEVFTAALYESLTHKGGILRLRPLKKCSLKLFLVVIGLAKYFFARKGVNSRIEHNR